MVVSVGCVVASVVDVSVVSIVSLSVVIMVVPFMLTSHTDDHVTQAVSTYAHIHTIVPANRLRYVISPVFVHTALSAVQAMGSICTYRTFLLEATNWSTGIARVVSVPVSISAVVASSTTHSTVSDALGSSPVFVPLFVPVISDVKASVQSAFCNVYVLLAEFVFVKNEVNVFATLRSQNIPSRNVFNPETV